MRRPWRRGVALGLVAALFLQSLLVAGFMAVVAGGAVAGTSVVALEIRLVTVCTPEGLTQLAVDAAGNPVDVPNHTAHEECPACRLAAQLVLAPPVGPGEAPTRCRGRIMGSAAADPWPAGRAPRDRQNRGPPSFPRS